MVGGKEFGKQWFVPLKAITLTIFRGSGDNIEKVFTSRLSPSSNATQPFDNWLLIPRTIPQPDDISVTAEVNGFATICDYRAYFGLSNENKSDAEYNVLKNQAIQVNTFWELSAEKRMEDENRLYYVDIFQGETKVLRITFAGDVQINETYYRVDRDVTEDLDSFYESLSK